MVKDVVENEFECVLECVVVMVALEVLCCDARVA